MRLDSADGFIMAEEHTKLPMLEPNLRPAVLSPSHMIPSGGITPSCHLPLVQAVPRSLQNVPLGKTSRVCITVNFLERRLTTNTQKFHLRHHTKIQVTATPNIHGNR